MPSSSHDSTSFSNRRGRRPPSSADALSQLKLQRELPTPHDTRSSSRRRGRSPRSSVRALTRLELERQTLNTRYSILDELIAEHEPEGNSNSTASTGAGVSATRNPTPRATETPAPAQGRSLVPPPLNPHRARSSSHTRSNLSARPDHRAHPAHPPLRRARTTAIPQTIARARSMQQEAALELAMVELDLELRQTRF
ncbi:hypothetical protein MMC07_001255 [Pseudocyphellaria aurata]|nr:hypothetical protein [Pseudocyphellaria aurata]